MEKYNDKPAKKQENNYSIDNIAVRIHIRYTIGMDFALYNCKYQ